MKYVKFKNLSMKAAGALAFTLALGVFFMTAPASAAQYYYTVPTASTSQVQGDVWTKYFNARVNLLEYNNQLMLNKVSFDQFHRQYVSEPYPIEFTLKGKDWSADLANPIRMGINNSFRSDGSYESIIRANIDFNTNRFGVLESRPAVATLRIARGENWNTNANQLIALEIADANNPNVLLYTSGTNLALEQRREVLSASLPLVAGKMDVRMLTPATNQVMFYNNNLNYSYIPGSVAVN